MNPKICPYCRQKIQPLDSHAARIVGDKPLETDKGLIPMQLVSCILTRCYIIEAKRYGDE